MRHATRFAGLLVLVWAASGCGGDKHEVVIKDTIQAMNDMADIVDTIKDEASAKAAEPKLKAVADRLQEIKKRADAMEKPSAEKEEALKKKYEGELKAGMGRMMGAAMKAASVPGAQQAVQDAFKGLQGQ